MFLNKLTIQKDFLITNKKDHYDLYALHQKIWDLTSIHPEQSRDFLYRIEFNPSNVIRFIYLLSTNKINSNEEFFLKASTEYNPSIELGDVYQFKLRANPIVRRKENNVSKEFSILLDAKHKLKKMGIDYKERFSLGELIYDVGFNWLTKKGKNHGFSIKHREIKIVNDAEYKMEGIPNKQPFSIRTLDFEGILTVTDVVQFTQTLNNGIGPAKAFGCGLLLVKPV